MNATLPHPPVSEPSPSVTIGLQAIAEPSRARIVALLGRGEHCVCDVGGALGIGPALVSHHLRVLRGAGLLRERRRGRWVYYSLDLAALNDLRAAITDLLLPTDAAAATSQCSDCNPGPDARTSDHDRYVEDHE